MECIKIYHDDKDEQNLVEHIKNILNERYESGLLTMYEVKKAKGNEY